MMSSFAPWRGTLARQEDALTPVLRSWLSEAGSLSARLQAACRHFRVQPLRQRLAPLGIDEAARLGLAPGALAMVREVLLLADEVPVIFAHSVLPLFPRHPFDCRFLALGQRSLGSSLLFADPRIARGRLEFRRLDRRHPLYQGTLAALGPQPPALWARRSRFGQAAKGLLVTEVFLPAILGLEQG